MNGVGRIPEVSVRNNRLRLERTHNAEVGIRRSIHSVDLAASAFYEDTLDGRINVAGDVGRLAGGNLLSDNLSTTSFLNIGNYRRSGLLLSSGRHISDNLDVSLAYGRMGGVRRSWVGRHWNFAQPSSRPIAGEHGGFECQGFVAAVGYTDHCRLWLDGEWGGCSTACLYYSGHALIARLEHLFSSTFAIRLRASWPTGAYRQLAKSARARLSAVRCG